jgi:hypothetical protein
MQYLEGRRRVLVMVRDLTDTLSTVIAEETSKMK